MIQNLLLDTTLCIDHLRGRKEAVTFMANLQAPPVTSVVVVAELYAGVREGPERAQLETFLDGLTVLPLTAPIAIQGGLFRRQYGKSHNVGLEDALIAATAVAAEATLVTLNRKIFRCRPICSCPTRCNSAFSSSGGDSRAI